MVVRPATLEDLLAVAILFDRYRQFYQQASSLEHATGFINARLSKKDSVILVASPNSAELAGFVQLYPSFSSVRMAKGWILNDLFVDAKWRRQGVGAALMDAAREFAISDDAAALWLATEKSNAKAKRLYKRLGYVLDEVFDHYELNLK